MASTRGHGRSPTPALLLGLLITLVTVVGYSWYISRQIAGLRVLQSDLGDRNRRDSLQLLRIQNDLNQLGLALRDMLDNDEPYPLTAWGAQFDRIRRDLENALAHEESVAVGERTPEQRQYLAASMKQFWDALDRVFGLARAGREDEARVQIRLSLQARLEALNAAVSRLLVQNNESEQQTAARVQTIYAQVQRQVYWFLAATLAAIVVTSLYMILANRRVFAQVAALSDERRELAQTLIATRDATLREISRELHDEFGQLLTAMGSMLGHAARQTHEGSALRTELHEIAQVAQTALDNVRGLSQTLHPAILDELGLESTITWYLSTAGKQLGLTITYDRIGESRPVDSGVAVHLYRMLQEAINNVARHSRTTAAAVRLRFEANALELEIEDHGAGIDLTRNPRGLGLVAMRERAALLGGTIAFRAPAGGGTLVHVRVPTPA